MPFQAPPVLTFKSHSSDLATVHDNVLNTGPKADLSSKRGKVGSECL